MMWDFGQINYSELIEFMSRNINTPYRIRMLENNKYVWNIFVLRENVFDSLPYFYTIVITQNNVPRGNNRCEFEITTTYLCHIINMDSDLPGLGSIMFAIMEQMVREIERKNGFKISAICGELSHKHRENGDWHTSIPFYCIQAYNLSYEIRFTPYDEICKYKQTSASHDQIYREALEFADKFIGKCDRGHFCINRLK